ncbi:TetR/AcrR family transcriptional regulator [Variovorax sp. VNK109]|jgi:TetR/AcrR family transcriptional repressor of nem operon|uniref:TetR/AcrR family transcriptional regulator n=1 Tax=Variovorax sp. VNK109 TaxID=3400919 RepID=UPI003C0F78A2
MKELFTGKKAQTHERILDVASRKVRSEGFRGLGVADVMKAAGLTHGGFYAHFNSRDELVAEALVRASNDVSLAIQSKVKRQAGAGATPLAAFIQAYLSEAQLANCAEGCPVAALCGEMPGQCEVVSKASHQAIANLHKLVIDVLPEGAGLESAWAITSTLVGAMQLARALGNNKQGRSVLTAARDQLLLHYSPS